MNWKVIDQYHATNGAFTICKSPDPNDRSKVVLTASTQGKIIGTERCADKHEDRTDATNRLKSLCQNQAQ